MTFRTFISKNFFYTLLLAYLTTLDVAELKVDDDAEEGGEDAEVGVGADVGALGGEDADADVGPGAESGPGLFFLSQSANLAEDFNQTIYL